MSQSYPIREKFSSQNTNLSNENIGLLCWHAQMFYTWKNIEMKIAILVSFYIVLVNYGLDFKKKKIRPSPHSSIKHTHNKDMIEKNTCYICTQLHTSTMCAYTRIWKIWKIYYINHRERHTSFNLFSSCQYKKKWK